MSFNSKEGEIEKKYGINSNKGNWLVVKEGNNKIRLISDSEDFGQHWDTQLKKSFICTGKDTCSYCQAGDKSRAQFMAYVLDREDAQVKLFQFGYKIYGEIAKLAKSEDYGFEGVPNYDITIIRKGKGLDTEYSILADRKDTKIAEEEEALILKATEKSVTDILAEMKEKRLKEMNVKETDTTADKIIEEEGEIKVEDIDL